MRTAEPKELLCRHAEQFFCREKIGTGSICQSRKHADPFRYGKTVTMKAYSFLR